MSHPECHTGKQLSIEDCQVSKIAITHLTPDIVDTLTEVLKVVKRPETGLELVLTNPAQTVRSRKQIP